MSVPAADASAPPASVRGGGPAGGQARFTLRAPGATRVAVIGDFNDWDPARGAMTRAGPDGPWTAVVDLRPGRHAYAFVVDGQVRRPPGAAEYAPDGFGGQNATLVVP
jgi:1,4-alpha-glucan branching enzyme